MALYFSAKPFMKLPSYPRLRQFAADVLKLEFSLRLFDAL